MTKMKIRNLITIILCAVLFVSCTAQSGTVQEPDSDNGRTEILKELQEVPEELLNAKKGSTRIGLTAILLAWPRGTDEELYSYPDGSPTPNYKKALDASYPNRKNWGPGPKSGACCDVYVGTVVRTAGYASDFPRGWDEQIDYLRTSDKFEQVPYSGDLSALQSGDIILYKRKSGGKHVLIFVEIEGKPYIAESQYEKYFGYIGSNTKKIRKYSNKKWIEVYRATR